MAHGRPRRARTRSTDDLDATAAPLGTIASVDALVRPDLAADPVAAVLSAHEDGRRLALATAGTTGGTGRRVVRSTTSWWASFDAYTDLSGVTRDARVWVPGPLRATMNLFAAVHAAVAGARLVDAPEPATHACLTPAQLDRDGRRLRGGTWVVVAGDRLPPVPARAAADRGLVTAHYYGAAELSFVAAGSSADDLRPFAGVDVEIRDGVVWVRSPYLSDGYAEGADGPFRREGDWATVGDLGRVDGDSLVVLGRPGHIVTGGATVSLAEVEAALGAAARSPFAVIGLPHASLGSVLAVVVTDPADEGRLRQHARALPRAQRPRLWYRRPALPMTPAGKVDRAALAESLRVAS